MKKLYADLKYDEYSSNWNCGFVATAHMHHKQYAFVDGISNIQICSVRVSLKYRQRKVVGQSV
jgi:hypothetical protein